ncbi:putative SSB protein [Bdellovibrio phage phi1402]|uniref:putative SSB protein n=1 Tax=Bdellovibrio phage phi1402 TaxID=1035662 RepID=UPI000211A2BF|nr:putative SSB protein [Bdellovibrio phage phi1402]AEG42298.1 putative SSB protein [Bdellovibrio phage phi1402]
MVHEVEKRETVKMHENDKGYKAVTHDDVAAALHLPLAECGVFMLPDIVKYETSSFDKPNSYGKMVTWYRTDLEISVQWINIDNPSELIQAKGAAFALDTSDKSFAKSYSLALKIVLLKVHLLASRDEEERRMFEEINGPDQRPQQSQRGNQNQGGNKNQSQGKSANQNQGGASAPAKNPPPDNQKKANEKPGPEHYVMPVGSDGVKGKKLGELPTNVLGQIHGHAEAALAKAPEDKGWKLIKANVELVIKARSEKKPDPQQDPPEPDLNDVFPEDNGAPGPDVENHSQEQRPKKPQPEDYVLTDSYGVDGVQGKALKSIPESQLRAVIKNLDSAMKTTPPPGNVGELFGVRNQIVGFFKTMDIKV